MKLRILIMSAAVSMASMASLSHAETVYKWTDDKGRVQYSDAPPPNRPSKVVEIDVREPTDAQRKAAEALVAKDKANLQPLPTVSAPSASPAPAAAAASSQLPPGDQSACRAEWENYRKSTDCFAPFVNVDGSLKPEAFATCRSVPQPREPCR
jgi:hypothetical protein